VVATCYPILFSGVTTLVRTEKPDDRDLEGLRSRVDELESMLGDRSAEVDRVTSELNAFRATYRQQVGELHEQLERLELEIAEAELGELSRAVGSGPDGASGSPADARPDPLPRYTSDAVRRLFRDVAKTIHPDLAGDDTRDRRHALMVEANRAYALGDEEQLRWILQTWETSADAVQGSDPEAIRLRLVRRVAAIERQLEMLARDLEAVRASAAWKLKAMVDEASAKGKDLVRDTVARLKRDILVATNRLEAMRSL
jgi:archaellum component FlaC